MLYLTILKGLILMLSKKSLKLLRYIKKHSNITIAALREKFGKSVDSFVMDLWKNEYIENKKMERTTKVKTDMTLPIGDYTISPKGLAKLESLPREKLKFWLPMTLSVIALIVSIISVYLQYHS
jgi:hypothetical protein